MDRETLIQIKALLDKLFANGAPSEEDLNYDDDAIHVYDAVESLQTALEEMGL